MTDYTKLCEGLRNCSKTKDCRECALYNHGECYPDFRLRIAADAIESLQAENAHLKAERDTEYMCGVKYAIYEIMKEADIRGSQEIRDSGDTDDGMCAAVAVKIREEIDGVVVDLVKVKAARDAAPGTDTAVPLHSKNADE